MIRPAIAIALVCCLSIIGWAVYRSALSEEEVARMAAAPPTIDWENVVDDPSEKLTTTWYPLPRFPSGREGTWAELQLEEQFNIDIKPILTDGTAYGRRKPLMFAGGAIPDYTFDGDPVDVRRDVHHGCLVPVPRWVIRKYAPTYARFITENDPNGWLFAYANGQNYGIPTLYIDGAYAVPGVWRMDYLRNVGIDKIPETLDEFHEALYRMTYDDPDGNGKDDTYGMSGNVRLWAFVFPEFFGAFGVLPMDWQEVDGRIVWGGIRPEAKQVLQLLGDWYAEGLIDPEFVTDGIDHPRRLTNKFINGHNGYAWNVLGTYFQFDPSQPTGMNNVLGKLYPEAEAVPAWLPIGPDGQRGVRFWGAAASVMVFGPGIVEKPQKVIRILKIIEYARSCDIDTYLSFLHGAHGLHWDYRVPDEGRPGTGLSSGVRRLPPYDDKQKFDREVLAGCYAGGANIEHDDAHTPPEQLAFRDTYRKKEWCLVDALGKPGVVPSAQRYLAELRNWQLTVYAEFIRGNRSLDTFDAFVEEWMKRGGRVMTEEANELLEVKREIFEEVGASRVMSDE